MQLLPHVHLHAVGLFNFILYLSVSLCVCLSLWIKIEKGFIDRKEHSQDGYIRMS